MVDNVRHLFIVPRDQLQETHGHQWRSQGQINMEAFHNIEKGEGFYFGWFLLQAC